jgi:hypothetical protein
LSNELEEPTANNTPIHGKITDLDVFAITREINVRSSESYSIEQTSGSGIQRVDDAV